MANTIWGGTALRARPHRGDSFDEDCSRALSPCLAANGAASYSVGIDSSSTAWTMRGPGARGEKAMRSAICVAAVFY